MHLFWPRFPAGLLYPGAIFRIKTSQEIICLTFDDGPDPGSTPEILEILYAAKAKALFFCNGRNAEKYPELVNGIKQKGHIVGNHGYSHRNGWKTSKTEYCEDAEHASQFTSGSLFRPPYGKISPGQYRQLKKSFRIVFWDLMSFDYDSSFGAERSLNLMNKKIRPGSVIVLHDTSSSTCRTFLKEFLETSMKKGYSFENSL